MFTVRPEVGVCFWSLGPSVAIFVLEAQWEERTRGGGWTQVGGQEEGRGLNWSSGSHDGGRGGGGHLLWLRLRRPVGQLEGGGVGG